MISSISSIVKGVFNCFDSKGNPLATILGELRSGEGFVKVNLPRQVYVQFNLDIGFCTFRSGEYLPIWEPTQAKDNTIPRQELVFNIGEDLYEECNFIIFPCDQWGFLGSYLKTAERMSDLPLYRIIFIQPSGEKVIRRTRGEEGLKAFRQSFLDYHLRSCVTLEACDLQSKTWLKIEKEKMLRLMT